ncbi:mPR-typeG-protein-coupled receptor [Usnea florida]
MARPRKMVSSKEATKTPMIVDWTPTLGSWDEIPSWQQDNEYILSGYRQATGSFARCFESLGYIHNETVNIFSHIMGAAIFLTAPICTYRASSTRYPKATKADIFVFSTFFYGVSVCFILSATYHIISNHSPKVAKFGNQLDYLGIVILIWGSTVPSIYYGFYCDPRLQILYWANVSILATLCIIATLHPRFRHPTLRPYRAAMYAGLGLSAVVFVVHGILLHGSTVQNRRMSVDWMGLMALFNLTGAAVYAARVPEKLHPLKYDIYGSSHQVLHIAVILAGLAHMCGLFRAFDYLHTDGSVCV